VMSEHLKPIRFKKGNLVAICAKAEPVAVVATLHGRDEAARCRVKMLFLLRDKLVTLYKVNERRKTEMAFGGNKMGSCWNQRSLIDIIYFRKCGAGMGSSYKGAKTVSKRVST